MIEKPLPLLRRVIRFGRSFRFSGAVQGEIGIWDLTVVLEGVPDPRSGMIVSLAVIDQWLQDASQELMREEEGAGHAKAVMAFNISPAGASVSLIEVALDDGITRRILFCR